MRIFLLIACCIVGFRHSSAAQEPNTQYRSLECVEIVDRQIESILDSVLVQEHVQPYFRENLTYTIDVLEDGLLIRAIGKNYFMESFKGVLQYKDHYFIVALDDWESLDSRLFARTGRKIELPFWENRWYENEQGQTIFIIALDDVMVYVYGYRNNKFEKVPFGNHLLTNP